MKDDDAVVADREKLLGRVGIRGCTGDAGNEQRLRGAACDHAGGSLAPVAQIYLQEAAGGDTADEVGGTRAPGKVAAAATDRRWHHRRRAAVRGLPGGVRRHQRRRGRASCHRSARCNAGVAQHDLARIGRRRGKTGIGKECDEAPVGADRREQRPQPAGLRNALRSGWIQRREAGRWRAGRCRPDTGVA